MTVNGCAVSWPISELVDEHLVVIIIVIIHEVERENANNTWVMFCLNCWTMTNDTTQYYYTV